MDIENDNGNGDIVPMNEKQLGVLTESAIARQAQEVQAAMIVAKKFPRDEDAALTRILKSCNRKGLAEVAMYEYSRGGTKICAPSIRMAEALAQAWGNLDFGIVELEQRNGESVVMSYAWDLETNCRQTKVFTVPHRRFTKTGSYPLVDPRDIYETVANNGARRLRACILGVIPGDIQDAAVRQCEETLSRDQTPLPDRIKEVLAKFAAIGISRERIEAKLQKSADAIQEQQLVWLLKNYQAIQDGVHNAANAFPEPVEPPSDKTKEPKSRAEGLKDRIKAKTKADAEALVAIAARKPEEKAPEQKPPEQPKREEAPVGDESWMRP